jgi:hypothetical protein
MRLTRPVIEAIRAQAMGARIEHAFICSTIEPFSFTVKLHPREQIVIPWTQIVDRREREKYFLDPACSFVELSRS